MTRMMDISWSDRLDDLFGLQAASCSEMDGFVGRGRVEWDR